MKFKTLTPQQKEKVLLILRMNGPVNPDDVEEFNDIPRKPLSAFLRTRLAKEAIAEGRRTLARFLLEETSSPELYNDPTDPALPELEVSRECIKGLRVYKRDYK
jgi:hypothetical protein